ncbi:MAG: class I tRNA ligase family protein, partial [Clostridia bacterium]|nr:class I tRNA ligase family protein [Clostridia bacterium]
WNASRFVLMNLEGKEELTGKQLELADKWILSRYHECAEEVTRHFDDCEFGMAAQKIYDFAWSEFCDWYIELAKGGLLGEDAGRKAAVRAVLTEVLSGLLRMLHPFMPFLTETVYSFLPGCEEASCMLSSWPLAEEIPAFPAEEAQMNGIMDIIRAVRNLRAEMNVQAGHKARLMVRPAAGWQEAVAGAEVFFKRLANASELDLLEAGQTVNEKTVGAVTEAGEILIPLGDLVDIEKEIARLNKERDNLLKEIARAEGKLSNQGFLAKAPAALVQQERDKLEANRKMLTALEARIEDMKK